MSTIKVNTIQDTGTNNAMTISGGTVTFPNKPIGANTVEVITGLTSGVTNAAQQDITLSTSTDYLFQKVIIRGIYSTTVADLYIYTGLTGGAIVDGAGKYYWRVNEGITNTNGANSTGGTGSDGDSKGRAVWYSIGNASSEKNMLIMDIYNSNTSSHQTYINGQRIGRQSDDSHFSYGNFGILMADATSDDRIRLKPSSGSALYVDDYIIYGYRSS